MSEKGDKAKHLMEQLEPYFESVRVHYESQLIDAPVNGSADNVGLLLDLKKMLVLLDDVKADLEADIKAGLLEDFRASEEGQRAFLGDINGRRKH